MRMEGWGLVRGSGCAEPFVEGTTNPAGIWGGEGIAAALGGQAQSFEGGVGRFSLLEQHCPGQWMWL